MTNGTYKVKVKIGDREVEVEGDKEFVEKFTNEWKDLLMETSSSTMNKEVALEKKNTKTLKQFYEEKSPSGHHEKVAVFAYYLKEHEGKDKFSKDDISRCYTLAGPRKPKNIQSAIVDSARKYQLTENAERGLWKLTDHGENLVLHDLPRKKE